VIRVAAVGDVHYDRHSRETLRAQFESLPEKADILLLAGDLTQSGAVEEAKALAHDLVNIAIPVVSVLGNHDYHQNNQNEIMSILRDVGVTPLEGSSAVFKIREQKVGVAGLKGFGGGFYGACITEFGEPEMKAFAHHCRAQSESLKAALANLESDYKFALLHFSPVEGTLLGERKEIYPFLGSYLLAEAIDAADVDGVFHGHAHLGSEKSETPGGVPVRNVAQMVIRHAFKVYHFE
jgi:Icc-related predicted phosphoesterase